VGIRGTAIPTTDSPTANMQVRVHFPGLRQQVCRTVGFVAAEFARVAMGWALLATLRTVAGWGEIGALPRTGSWTDSPGQTVQSGLSAA
jgi:hypothetical protein